MGSVFITFEQRSQFSRSTINIRPLEILTMNNYELSHSSNPIRTYPIWTGDDSCTCDDAGLFINRRYLPNNPNIFNALVHRYRLLKSIRIFATSWVSHLWVLWELCARLHSSDGRLKCVSMRWHVEIGSTVILPKKL